MTVDFEITRSPCLVFSYSVSDKKIDAFQMLGIENKTGSEDLVRRGLFRF